MAKELAMVENNEQGRKVRRYFIEVEKQFRNVDAVAAAQLERLKRRLMVYAETIVWQRFGDKSQPHVRFLITPR